MSSIKRKPWYMPYFVWFAQQRAEYYENQCNELNAYIAHKEDPNADRAWCPVCWDFTQQTWNESAELSRCHICGKLVE